jgi:hypothetical protein
MSTLKVKTIHLYQLNYNYYARGSTRDRRVRPQKNGFTPRSLLVLSYRVRHYFCDGITFVTLIFKKVKYR